MKDIEQIKLLFKRYDKVTHGSHYVKREYLSNWSIDKTRVLASQNGQDFKLISLNDICTKRDLYKMELLSDYEVALAKAFYQHMPKEIIAICDDYVDSWQLACKLANELNSDLNDLTNKMKIQTGEDLQTTFEGAYTENIKKCLNNLDESFLNDDSQKLDFLLYIISQYLRTTKQKQQISNNLAKCPTGVNPERIWKILIPILTYVASFDLLKDDNLHLTFVYSRDGMLETSDQPIINIADDPNKDFILYYPLNPSVGIIFPSKVSMIIDTEKMVNRMNNLIEVKRERFFIKPQQSNNTSSKN